MNEPAQLRNPDAMAPLQVYDVFMLLEEAIASGRLIERAGSRDKEFHFQDWFARCLKDGGIAYVQGGRNSYPDFRLKASAEGFEIKGLAVPGRDANYDSNSQPPTGWHEELQIYYVFGRYPKQPEGDRYPVVDLVVCHGSFLNADTEYVHKNKSARTFGSFGDIMIRDRKMYVVPTPFALLEGTIGERTLILPDRIPVDDRFSVVSRLSRREARRLLVGYDFDLRTNQLTEHFVENPTAGTEHPFTALRARGSAGSPVAVKELDAEALQEGEEAYAEREERPS